MTMQTNDVELIGVTDGYKVEQDGTIIRCSEQEFPLSYWKGLDWAREQDSKQRCQDLWKVAEVPAIFIERWLREGFDALQAPIKEVVRRCRDEHLDDFVLTRKRVY